MGLNSVNVTTVRSNESVAPESKLHYGMPILMLVAVALIAISHFITLGKAGEVTIIGLSSEAFIWSAIAFMILAGAVEFIASVRSRVKREEYCRVLANK